MNEQELKQLWQQQPDRSMPLSDLEIVRQMKKKMQKLDRDLLWRDVREVGVSGLMAVGFMAWGIWWQWWSLCLLSVCCFGLGAFMLVDRLRRQRREPASNESLQTFVKNSLFQVNHQIWLLRNIFWWYLLPVIIGVGTVFGQLLWSRRSQGPSQMISLAAIFMTTYGVTFGFVYWANQNVVKKRFIPLKVELERTFQSLSESLEQA